MGVLCSNIDEMVCRESLSRKKKAGGAAAAVGTAAAAVGATAAFLQPRESSSLLTLRGCSDERPPGQTSLARHTASIASALCS